MAVLFRAFFVMVPPDFDVVGHYARPNVFRLQSRSCRCDPCGSGKCGYMKEGEPLIHSLLDACRFILEDQGEARSSYWLASQVVEMRLWRASESDIRDALDKDIKEQGKSSLFVKVAQDEYALRSWAAR